MLQDVAGRERFVDVLDAATARLLREDAFTDYGREWLSTVIAALRSKVATSAFIEAGPAA